jgi:hypothetical protein
MKNIKFEKYSGKHKDNLLEMLQLLWKELNENEIKERFAWRYEHNPLSIGKPYIYLALNDDIIIGIRAFVFQKFINNKKTYNVLTPADAIVDPNYRRMGIFSKLNDFFLKDLNSSNLKNVLILNLSTNQYSFAGNIKQGWEKLRCSIKFGYKISVKNIFNYTFGGLKSKKPAKNQTYTIGDTQIIISQTIKSEEMAGLAERFRNKNKFTNIRDSAFFNWRYSYDDKRIYFVYCYINNILQGYLILKKVSNIYFFLEEYRTINNRILKQMIQKSFSGLNYLLLRAWISSSYENKTMKECTFFIEPSLIIKIIGRTRNPILVRPISIIPQKSDYFIDNLDLKNCNNWELFHSDIH